MAPLKSRVLPVTSIKPPHVNAETSLLDWWKANKDTLPQDQVNYLLEAAHSLQTSSIPVAFPTETVYGLGADATRSEAVRGIYTAKQRPSDNPLIVHVGSLGQLRALLRPPTQNGSASHPNTNGIHSKKGDEATTTTDDDPIPAIYHPLISRFWPGPLSLLFPLPQSPSLPNSSPPTALSPLISPSLPTVAIRIPSSPLARLLILLADRPLAAPSANASTRPSPTTSAHVLHDLVGRIEIILDGGNCAVGVESTVVDGLGERPAVLRPGGVGIGEIREVGGVWAQVEVAYQDRQGNANNRVNGETNRSNSDREGKVVGVLTGDIITTTTAAAAAAPRAPGMKYRHYAPRAPVHLFEARDPSSFSSLPLPSTEDEARAKILEYCLPNTNNNNNNNNNNNTTTITSDSQPAAATTTTTTTSTIPGPKIGIIATQHWRPGLGFPPSDPATTTHPSATTTTDDYRPEVLTFHVPAAAAADLQPQPQPQLFSIRLGPDIGHVARGLFGALRELDARGVGLIVVEGVREDEDEDGDGDGDGEGGHLRAAVMDRLRKAAAAAAAAGG